MSKIRLAHIQRPSLALCLSGGGLRATFFHLGVIKGLRESKIGDSSCLKLVSEIYSVSGGSIIAAHLIMNWEKYCGTEKEFEEISGELIKFADRDLRGRVVQRWLLSIIMVLPKILGGRRTYWLAKEYENLYGKSCLGDFYKKNSVYRPSLNILATSFKTGELCSFSPEGFEITQKTSGEIMQVSAKADLLQLSFAVAASSAFPPLFPPVKLTSEMLGEPDADEFQNPLYLSDGGIFDNLGFEKFYFNKTSNRGNANAVLLSNAGSSFRSDVTSSFSDVVSRNVRATDIMMRRVAENTDERALQLPDVAVIDVRIGHTAKDGDLPITTQQRLRGVRTDLDRFPPELVSMLVDHGTQVSKQALGIHGCTAAESLPSKPKGIQADSMMLDKTARNAAKRSLLQFNFRDWTTYLLALIFVIAIALVVNTIKSSFETGKAEAIARKAKVDAIDAKAAALTAKEAEQKATAAQNEALRRENIVLKDNEAASQQYRVRVLELQEELAELRRKLPPPVVVNSNAELDNDKYRVWIQFAGNIKREEMVDFGRKIQIKWKETPGAERGGERTQNAAGLQEVRYGPEEDRAAAIRLTNDINAMEFISTMSEPRQFSKIPPRSLEIWVSR